MIRFALRSMCFAAVAALLAACGGVKPSSSAEAETSMAAHMHGIFGRLDKVRAAVVEGDLATAKTRAAELGASLAGGDYPEEWSSHMQRLREAVTATRAARDLETAALETARAGSACGRCHAALGAVPVPVDAAPPAPSSSAVTDLMNRHSWAAERMWQGLVGPSDAAWTAASESLAETAAVETDTLPDQMRDLASALAEIAERSGVVGRPDEREEVFGEFLATCASCHHSYRSNKK